MMLDPFYVAEPEEPAELATGRKLSLLEAFTGCRQQWRWVIDNPNKSKSDYPYFEIDIECSCYMCTYKSQQALNCSKCPMLTLWGGVYDSRNASPCVSGKKSPFHKWAKHYDALRAAPQGWFGDAVYAWRVYAIRRNARKIVDFCDKKIELILSRIPEENQY
jgi:hypothetical protein